MDSFEQAGKAGAVQRGRRAQDPSHVGSVQVQLAGLLCNARIEQVKSRTNGAWAHRVASRRSSGSSCAATGPIAAGGKCTPSTLRTRTPSMEVT